MITHRSNFGTFGGDFRADLDGYVATTATEILTLRWDGDVTDRAGEFAEINAEEVRLAEHAIAAWHKVADEA